MCTIMITVNGVEGLKKQCRILRNKLPHKTTRLLVVPEALASKFPSRVEVMSQMRDVCPVSTNSDVLASWLLVDDP